MADKDTLPAKGLPFFALVDSTGVAVGGTATIMQLAQRGMRPICQVDATGMTDDGVSISQLASRGIRAFCLVDETGVDPDTSATVLHLSQRGIRALCKIGADGIAQDGTATIYDLARRGIGYFVPLDEDGNVPPEPSFASGALSFNGNAVDTETITIGATVYTLVAVLVDANDVLIGATASITIQNLIAAITAGPGEGTVYGTGTVAHPDVTASSLPGQMIATAKVAGVAGNSIATTSTSATATWGAATLQGGA